MKYDYYAAIREATWKPLDSMGGPAQIEERIQQNVKKILRKLIRDAIRRDTKLWEEANGMKADDEWKDNIPKITKDLVP